jgi:hypothetical protein
MEKDGRAFVMEESCWLWRVLLLLHRCSTNAGKPGPTGYAESAG